MPANFEFTNYKREEAQREYDRFYSRADFRRHRASEDAFVRTFIAKFRIPAGARLLDIGCGTGKYTDLFRRHGLNPVGVDLSAEGISHAQTRYPETDYRQGDATNLPFELNSFDIVFCSGLSLFNEPDTEALAALAAYLASFVRPGGFFVFVKTSSLTDRPSITNSRLDYSVDSFIGILTSKSDLRVVASTATAPQSFLLLGALSFTRAVQQVSTVLARLIRRPVRVYIVLRRTG